MTILVDADGMTATWQQTIVVLSPLQVRILLALADGRRLPRKDLMSALDIKSVRLMNQQMTALRRRFATHHIPLGVQTFEDGYEMHGVVSFTSSHSTKKLDRVGLRIVRALIQTCSDPVIADMARRHFLE